MLSFFVGFSNLALCQFSYPIAFRLSQRRRIQINEFERHRVILCDHHNGVEACFMWSVTSFNYNVMPDSIFHKSMRQGITCSVSFCLLAFFFAFFCYKLEQILQSGEKFVTKSNRYYKIRKLLQSRLVKTPTSGWFCL